MINKLPNGAIMDSNYLTKNILGLLKCKISPAGRLPHEKRLVIRMDDSSIHNSGVRTSFLAYHNTIQPHHTRQT
jgi:hypothetical protein